MPNEIAGEKPVEKSPEVIPAASQEPTAADLIAAKDAEIAKLAEERDNYRRGMLKAKGKLVEDVEPENEDDNSRVKRLVQEALYDEKIGKAQAEKDGLLTKISKENEELKNALRSRPGGMPSSMGSNLDKAEPEKHYWTPEQEFEIKAKFPNIDLKKAWENVQNGLGIAGK